MNRILILVTIITVFGIIEARQKGGTCKTKQKRELCQCAPNGPDNCHDVCNSDNDCPGTRKCCYNNCNRVCVLPDITHRQACPQGEEYDICGPAVSPTCTQPIVRRTHCVSGCYCPPGYVRNGDGRCIRHRDCPSLPLIRLGVCSGRHETYRKSCPGCDRTCAFPNAEGCARQCAEGCYCVDGYVRNGLGHCIARSACPSAQPLEGRKALTPSCPYNQEFQSCRRTCEPTCAKLTNEGCLRKCQTGCFCSGSFVRDYSGNCIPASECPEPKRTEPKCTEEHTEYKVCQNKCLPTCDNPTGTRCSRQCVTGCFCRANLVWHNGKCINPQNCPASPLSLPPPPALPVCENEREEYIEEGGCRRTCDDPTGSHCDRSQNIKGCYCRNNYVTDPYGNCILPDQCQDPPCGEHEVFEQCGPDCMETCNGKVDCVPRGTCVSGCYCEPGYVKNTTDNTCIHRNRCTVRRVACPDGAEESSSCNEFCHNKCINGYSGSACPSDCHNRCCRSRN